MRRVFGPSRAKLILWALFVVLAVGGFIQASEFGPHAGRHHAVVRALHPFPLWVTFVYLVAPLAYLVLPLNRIGFHLWAYSWWVIGLVMLLYFYLFACLLVMAFRGGHWLVARLARSV